MYHFPFWLIAGQATPAMFKRCNVSVDWKPGGAGTDCLAVTAASWVVRLCLAVVSCAISLVSETIVAALVSMVLALATAALARALSNRDSSVQTPPTNPSPGGDEGFVEGELACS